MIKKVALFPLWLVLSALVKVYQFAISPLLGKRCCFTPTCSTYALQSLKEFGPLLGSWIALKRLARCHPHSCGGFDPVPINLKGDNRWVL